jgi:hypothetical protein
MKHLELPAEGGTSHHVSKYLFSACLILLFCLVYSSTSKMEMLYSSKMLVDFQSNIYDVLSQKIQLDWNLNNRWYRIYNDVYFYSSCYEK